MTRYSHSIANYLSSHLLKYDRYILFMIWNLTAHTDVVLLHKDYAKLAQLYHIVKYNIASNNKEQNHNN